MNRFEILRKIDKVDWKEYWAIDLESDKKVVIYRYNSDEQS